MAPVQEEIICWVTVISFFLFRSILKVWRVAVRVEV